MNSLSMISLPSEILQRMYALRQSACGGERAERRAALLVAAAAVLAAVLFALLGG